MKKEVFCFVLFCFVLIPCVVAGVITGDVVATGEVTSSGLGMSISVVGPPSLNILSPMNKTYLTGNILLNYNVGSNNATWYSLDGGSNISLESSINLHIGEGSHFLYIYANNSYGTSFESVVFSVNSSKLILSYEEYNNSGKGGSTNFHAISYEDLQSLGDIVLERSDYGKISFSEVINVSDDLDSSDGVVDLDSYTDISFNSIFLDPVELPNFDKPAVLSFYNLSFSNPRILIDGEVCSVALCNIINYSEGTLEFNVDHFSTYSAEETPEDAVVETSGGGGRGRVEIPEKVFSVDTDQIGVKVKRGRIVTKKVTIVNKKNSKLNVNIRVDELGDIAILSDSSFTLGPLESKEILVDFVAREAHAFDIYMGQIIIMAEDSEENILLSVVIESKTELFDVSITIPEDYIEVFAGKDFLSEVELFNLGETGRIDAKIEYFIKNVEGETVISEEEVKAIETSLNFVKSFHIPSDLSPGKYIVYVQVSYGDQVLGSSAWFSVVEGGFEREGFFVIDSEKLKDVVIAIVILILSAVIVRNRFRGTSKRRYRK